VSVKFIAMGSLLFVVLFFVVLMLAATFMVPLGGLWETLSSPRLLYSLRLSLVTATMAATSSMLVALPAAYALSRYDFFAKPLVDTFAELPVILSPVALGAVLLIFLSGNTGSIIQEYGIRFVFEIPGIVLAQWTSTVGVAIRLLTAIFNEVPPRFENVARSLGATPSQSLRYVTLPMAGRGILITALFVWAKALGEFGATITVAGSMAMKTETLPIAISNALSGAEIDRAVLLILILAGTGIVVLFLARLLTAGGIRDTR
jgi:molybdate transport system permease protein